jgi:membrane protease YdiL (CAAX protease family)
MSGPKKLFAAVFFLSIILFIMFLVFIKQSYLYEIFLQFAFLSAAFYLLWDENVWKTLADIGIPGNLKTNVLWTVIGGVLVFATMLVFSVIFLHFNLNDNYKVYDILRGLPFWLVLLAVIGAPITEELLFRAALVPRLGVIVSGLVFGLFHIFYGSVSEIAGATAIGIILAFIFKKSRSIIPPIIIHFVLNLITVSVVLSGAV